MTLKAVTRSLFAICLGLSVSPANAVTEIPMSFSDLVERADDIVVGTVLEMTSMERFIGDHERVVTDVSLVDLEVIKGETENAEMVVTQLGGQVGDVVEWYPGLPVLRMERRYVVFLIRMDDLGLAMPIGLQGLFSVETDPLSTAEVVASASGQPVLAVQGDLLEFGITPDGPIDTAGRLTGALTLEQFLKEVKARLD
jgi:hypothetical protein